MNKQIVLHWAEVIDSLRVVPRLFLFGYWITIFVMIFWIFGWYMGLDANSRGNQESGLIGVVILTLIGFGKTIFDTYVKNGRDWNQQPPSTVSTAITQTTTTGTP